MGSRQIYQFGAFSVDATAKVLSRDDKAIRIPRKAIETLLVLVQNPGRVLTKAELISTVWPDRVVEEGNLTQNIAVLRKALQVPDGDPGSIETFAGRGYCLMGPVAVVNEACPVVLPDVPPPAPGSRVLSHYKVAVFILLLTGVGIGLTGVWKGVIGKSQGEITMARLVGKEYQLALSPDGRRVAFAWQRAAGEPTGIVLSAPSGEQPVLLASGTGAFISPAWSPDGLALAYRRNNGVESEIRIHYLKGGTGRSVASVSPIRNDLLYHHLDWSPDGKELAFDDPAGSGPSAIFLLSLDTGRRRKLTTPDPLTVGDVEPRFSPDGRKLSFIRVQGRSRQELLLLDLNDLSLEPLTSDGKQISSQDWSGDGSTLLFSSNWSGGFRLWAARKSGGRYERKAVSVSVASDFSIQITTARSARLLAYSILRQVSDIWKLDLDKGDNGWSQLMVTNSSETSPVTSPAGDFICFRSDRSGEAQLWVANIDGSHPEQVTRGSFIPWVGRWSHDGTAIAFHSTVTQQILIATRVPKGSWAVREIGAHGQNPVFSLDDRALYAGQDNSIVRIPVAGGPADELIRVPAFSLVLSGDGRFLYYVSAQGGTSIWRLDVSTRRQEKVLDALVPYCSNCWALASDGIYYLGLNEKAGHQSIYFHPWKSGPDREVVPYPEALEPFGNGAFSLTTSGRSLLCVRPGIWTTDITRIIRL